MRGIEEALKLGLQVQEYSPFGRVISSDLRRAGDTTRLATAQQPRRTSLLRERHFAGLEGEEVTPGVVHFLYGRHHNDRYHDQIVPGAETEAQMEDRWHQFFEEYGPELAGETSFLGTHGGMVVNLLSAVGHRSGERVSHIRNAAFAVFEAEDGPKVSTLQVVKTSGVEFAEAV